MKKLVKICLFLMIFSFNINVLAENGQEEGASEVTGASNDATLTDVYINEQKVVCSDYVCELIIEDNDVANVVITYKTNDAKATVSTEKIEDTLKSGENTYTVTVTAEDGTEQIYTFKVTKKVLSTDSSLKKLLINGEEITLSKGTTKYQTTVSYATNKLDVEVETTDSNASLVDSNTNKLSYDFFETEKELRIKVQAEAGDITTYVINVSRRDEADATLKSLTIEDVDLNFESEIFDYEVTVLRNVTSLEIDAVPTDSEASVTIDNPKNLEIGENTVTIEVDNDGNIKTYTIKVTKLDEEDITLANLKSLTIEGYTIDFKEDVYEYNLKIGDVNFLVIDAIPKVDTAQVEITGNLDLVDGSIIKIKVSYDDEVSNVYKINISKDLNVNESNTTLKIVIIIVIVLIVIAAVVLLIIQKKKKNKQNGKKNDKNNNKKDTKDNGEEVKIEQDDESKTINTEEISNDDELIDII